MKKHNEKGIIGFLNFLRNNKNILFIAIMIAVVSWGYEMSNFALTIDEEANWGKSGIDYFIRRVSDGRFTLGFIKLFLPRVFLPFWSTAIFAIGMVINGGLLLYVFDKHFKNTLSKVAVVGVFISFPIHAFYVMFSMQSAEMALAYFMIIYSVYLVDQILCDKRKDFKAFLCAVILIILANGVYQVYFCVYCILVCALISLDLLAEEKISVSRLRVIEYWKRIGGHIFCLVVGGIGYIVVTKVLQGILAPSRNYIESYFQWGMYDFVETIKLFIKTIIRISWSTEGDLAYVTMWLFSTMFIVLLCIGLKCCNKGYKILYLIAMCGMFISNFLMMFIAGNTVPVRLYLTLPIFAAIVLATFVEKIVKEKTQVVIGVFIAIIVLIQSASITDLFWAEDRQKENDTVMMTKMTSEIAQLGGTWVPDEPVIICSDISYESYEGTFGFSYFSLGERIYGYLSMQGFDYKRGNREQMNFASAYAKTMPVFPAEGSIVKENGVIIVNLQ